MYGKAKANSIQLHWSYPENDGGSQILSYEIFLNQQKPEQLNIVIVNNQCQ